MSTAAMHRAFLIVAFLPAALLAQAGPPRDVWAPLKCLVGTWEGTAASHANRGTAACKGRFIFDGAFLRLEDRLVFAPCEQLPKGATFEDVGFISYDRERKTFVLRQFHGEGFVNQYVLDSLSTDGTTIIFVSESAENMGPGWRAKEQYEIFDNNEFVELYKLAPPGGEFEVYSEAHFMRKDR